MGAEVWELPHYITEWDQCTWQFYKFKNNNNNFLLFSRQGSWNSTKFKYRQLVEAGDQPATWTQIPSSYHTESSGFSMGLLRVKYIYNPADVSLECFRMLCGDTGMTELLSCFPGWNAMWVKSQSVPVWYTHSALRSRPFMAIVSKWSACSKFALLVLNLLCVCAFQE